MARRVVVEEPCPECGKHHFMPQLEPGGDPESSIAYCVDGTERRVLDPGSYVLIEKVDGQWPPGWWALTPLLDDLAALAGGEQP